MLNNNELKAKCAVLEGRAVIIEKSANTNICYHYFDMLGYNNNIIDAILVHTTFRITSIGAMRNTISLNAFSNITPICTSLYFQSQFICHHHIAQYSLGCRMV